MHADPDSWFPLVTPQPEASLRLFCFPYAGGSAASFRTWRRALAPEVEVWAVQSPGRGKRLREAPFERVEDLAPALVPALVRHLDRPYALYGHSLGAFCAYEVCLELARRGAVGPSALVVSGSRAPDLPRDGPVLHGLDDDAFLTALRELGGTPEAVLADRELMELFLPSLRADFAMAERYLRHQVAELDVPLHAIGGTQDDYTRLEVLEGWRAATPSSFRLHTIEGGHFFLHEREAETLALLRSILLRS